MGIVTIKRLLSICLLGMALFTLAGRRPAPVAAAPMPQASCTLPVTVTTASQLSSCITAANAGSGGIITLGADIMLSTALPQITTEITVEGAGYAIDGNNSRQIFNVGVAGDLAINQITLQNGSALSGSAIYNDGALTVTNSTIVGNSATNSGAIYNASLSTVTVSNSTFSGNSSDFHGGGIHNDGGTLTATNNTFFGNSANYGNSIANYWASDRVYLAGNIFADNSPIDDNCVTYNGNVVDIFIDNGYNLSDDASCINGGPGSAANATLNLGALADNSGPTQTHLPGVGSDAIGAIPNGTTISNNGTSWTCNDADPFTDQRGVARPVNTATDCTVGAVEVEPPPLCPPGQPAPPMNCTTVSRWRMRTKAQAQRPIRLP